MENLNSSVIQKVKLYVVWLTIVSAIYLRCCPLLFENPIYRIVINHIPYVLLFVIDFFIVREKHQELTSIIKFFVKNNKFLAFSIGLFVIYDMITILYAPSPSYSIKKYYYFIKIIFLCISIFLCVYEDHISDVKKNLEFILRSIGWILGMILITTVIEWTLGLTPFVQRVSTVEDYNIYASFLMFTLLFFVYYHLEREEIITRKKKILYIVIGIIAYNFLYLSASRRAVVLAPITAVIFIITYIVRNKIVEKKNNSSPRKTKYLFFFIFIIVLFMSPQVSISSFEKLITIEPVSVRENFNHGSSLTYRYETINTDEGLSSRENIWDIAISEIKTYNARELLLGKGNGYSWNIYEDKDNEAVKELFDYYNFDQMKPQWMHPHNMLLKEFLDGGIIKICLLLFVIIEIMITWYKVIRKYFVYGMLFLSVYICRGGDFILGGTYGFLGEDLFWLATAILIVLNTLPVEHRDSECIKSLKCSS